MLTGPRQHIRTLGKTAHHFFFNLKTKHVEIQSVVRDRKNGFQVWPPSTLSSLGCHHANSGFTLGYGKESSQAAIALCSHHYAGLCSHWDSKRKHKSLLKVSFFRKISTSSFFPMNYFPGEKSLSVCTVPVWSRTPVTFSRAKVEYVTPHKVMQGVQWSWVRRSRLFSWFKWTGKSLSRSLENYQGSSNHRAKPCLCIFACIYATTNLSVCNAIAQLL
jgi:hypothetical protein